MERSSGILMPVSSLPSPYGIGSLGKAAFEFVDFLAVAGQTWWQILPVGPTSVGDSPYQSPSAYAGNPYLIDLDLLVEDGLLTKDELKGIDFGDHPEYVDYGKLYENRMPLLRKAFDRGYEKDREKLGAFVADNSPWLPDFALYMALKRHFNMQSWQDWPDDAIRLRRPEAVDRYRELLEEDIRFYTYLQYLFFAQWKDLREYAHKNHVKIMGDLPLYVALDSADVWASSENFQLDENLVPKSVAGVPPDYFCEDGQLWGNPLYDYDFMQRDGFGWWIRRIGGADKLYDAIRIDHFRGLESYWAVPYGDKTARNGRWIKGPGMALVDVLKGWFPQIQFIAEDLGFPTPELERFLKDSGFPGMKVLEFAFDAKDSSSYLPHAFERNCVCYVGTHDNDTLVGWKDAIPAADLKKAIAYLGLNEEEGFVRGVLRGGMSSVANLFVMQMQDLLELGNEARMNEPGTMTGNWRWRMRPGKLTKKLAKELYDMTKMYDRVLS